ncbi:hypothetical protein Tco_0665518 [Tanacetum coccineum]
MPSSHCFFLSICPSHDSDGELGTVFNANSTVYSSCQSNDSDGDQGTISDHTVQDNPTNIPSIEQVTIATQTTQPKVLNPNKLQNWNQRIGKGIKVQAILLKENHIFVCGSLSHLIEDCDYYEKKMARKQLDKSNIQGAPLKIIKNSLKWDLLLLGGSKEYQWLITVNTESHLSYADHEEEVFSDADDDENA